MTGNTMTYGSRKTRYWIAGWVAFVLILGMMQRCADGRCSEPSDVPPVITEMKRTVVRVKGILNQDHNPSRPPPTSAMPHDGPMCFTPGEPANDEISEDERRRVEAQISLCLRKPGRYADAWGLLHLNRLEEQLNVPHEHRGILATIWCIEGAVRSDRVLRGDWKDGVARAHGPFQLHGWAYSLCGLLDGGRDDLDASARCYWSRVMMRHEAQASGACKPEEAWRVAEALVANAPRYAPYGCRAKSAHWRELEAWNGAIRQDPMRR